jgi:recombination protein RecT
MRLAATVILARDARSGVEVLMLQRSSRSAFAPRAFVFPGGTVDPSDYVSDLPGWTPERLTREFRATVPAALPSSESAIAPEQARALLRAAVREVREEASIAIEPEALLLFSHWITPPTEPRRYNTHFFVTRAPQQQPGIADSIETHDARWIGAAEALEHHRRGAMHLIYPTIMHLERLRDFHSVDALLDYALRKPILTIMPDRSPAEGFVMPDALEGRW